MWLTMLEVFGLRAWSSSPACCWSPGRAGRRRPRRHRYIGLIMVFVLLTYGGWSEAVYVSAELQRSPRRMGR